MSIRPKDLPRGAATAAVDGHLESVLRADGAVESIEEGRDRLRAAGRVTMGVTGDGKVDPLRTVFSRSGLKLYPLVALSLLVIVDEFQRNAFAILGPEISRSLGIGPGVLGALIALSALAVTLSALPIAALVQRTPRRGLVAIVTAFAWSVATLFTGFVRTPLGMLGILVADGATTGSVQAVHAPLIFDHYPPEVRIRSLSFYRAADFLGRVIAPLLVAVLATLFQLTWRGVFVALGLVSLLAALYSVRLHDPGFGRWDTQRIRQSVRAHAGHDDEAELAADDVSLGFFEIVRRLFLLRTVRLTLIAFALVGVMFIPLATFLPFYLDDRGLGPGARGVFSAVTSAVGVVALLRFGSVGERLFRQDPGVMLRRTSLIFAASLIALALGILSPVLVGTYVLVSAFYGGLAIVLPILTAAIQGVVPARMRPHAAALTGIFTVGVGGFAGLAFLGGIDRRFGVAGAIVSLTIPGLIGAMVLHRTSRTINADLDRMVEEVIEEEELRTAVAGGRHLPLLSCRNIDFAYGQLQVLFDVSFTVDDGEMVALLGTNGAGKSTLLRVISGLGLPSRGSVRFRGADITYLDAARRVKLGISQIPGGKAVFSKLSVVDNMRAYAYSLGRSPKVIDHGIDATFDAFPRLAERRNQPAGTLSGGEAQMLAIGKALILKPRLLAIDELSLGLAPKVVGELLEMVRRINAAGTAIVLVEQSVNIALSLVDHAYFMEKGEIRFDGGAADLIGRGDLLRSVFLEGATKGVPAS